MRPRRPRRRHGRRARRSRRPRRPRNRASAAGLRPAFPNRQVLTEALRDALGERASGGAFAALLFLDLDRFKKVNELVGHAAGDELLAHVAARLRGALRRTDLLGRGAPEKSDPTVAHMGGDEFIVLVTGLEAPDGAARIAQRLLDGLAAPFQLGGRQAFVTASIGIAVQPARAAAAGEMLQQAESAMYRAKRRGGNRSRYHDQRLDAESGRRLELETALHWALERRELAVWYQAILDTSGQRIVAAEALLRWHHPRHGFVSPEEFIPLAEEAGLIDDLGLWVLRESCTRVGAWQRGPAPGLRLAVNLSCCQLRSAVFARRVAAILGETGFDPARLEVEITERGVMLGDPQALDCVEQLKRLGVRVAIDDFGTGHSALTYLKRLPVDSLKIDRSFVADIEQGSSDAAIISAVIAMAHRLHLRVIGEGVETAAQLDFLRRQGCDEVQGFLFSRPLPPEEFARLLAGEALERAVRLDESA